MFEVQLDAEFSATHQLRLVDGGFEALHAHHWPVQVVVRGANTDSMGLLIDFHWLGQLLEQVIGPLRHTSLNDHPDLGALNPSAEHVARYIAEQLRPRLPLQVQLMRVTVGEAPGCWATYVPDRIRRESPEELD